MIEILPGDSRDILPSLPDCSVDACVTDPPYALNFMGKTWDTGDAVYDSAFWSKVLRVLKPGAHLVAFGGTRTYHRMACAIEDAGFEIRDQLQWIYGSGFPKSHDVSKGIDRARDDRADILRVTNFIASAADRVSRSRADIDAHMGTSDMAGWWTSRLLHRCQCPRWDQWLQLKAFLDFGDEMDAEVWRLNGRKGQPGEAWDQREVIGEGTSRLAQGQFNAREIGACGYGYEADYNLTAPATDAAREWDGWGTALKPACEPICLARKPLSEGTVAANVLKWGTGAINVDGCRVGSEQVNIHGYNGNSFSQSYKEQGTQPELSGYKTVQGRWPANVLHDGSAEVVGLFPENNNSGNAPGERAANSSEFFFRGKQNTGQREFGDSGSAARFFYSAKADSDDRLGSRHPTVKPVDLMQWLCRLVTPKGGTILDPFAGTGTTGEAAFREGFSSILIERDPAYIADIRRRFKLLQSGPDERRRESIKAWLGDTPPDYGPLFAY